MSKRNIQTSLLDKPVQFVADRAYANEFGRIRSVYLDSDGTPCYTIQLDSGKESGKLIDTYSFHFTVRGG